MNPSKKCMTLFMKFRPYIMSQQAYAPKKEGRSRHTKSFICEKHFHKHVVCYLFY